MQSRELIIGASGLVGAALLQAAHASDSTVLGTYCHTKVDGLVPLDITDPAALQKLLTAFAPDIIYLPAAIVNAEQVERDPTLTKGVNVDAVAALVDLLQNSNTHLVYFSSDYVFDGLHPPYKEDDLPLPVNEYGRQKVMAEEIIRERLPQSLIIRTGVVYGLERQGKNFAMRTVRELRAGRHMQVAMDQSNNPTYAPDLAAVARELAAKRVTGVLHAVGPQTLARFDFACEICSVFELPVTLLIPVPSSALKQGALRPENVCLDTTSLERIIGRKMLAPREGLLQMKRILPA